MSKKKDKKDQKDIKTEIVKNPQIDLEKQRISLEWLDAVIKNGKIVE